MSENTEVIFITGSGRSGTNILKKIFSQLPDVASLPFESRFMVDPKGIIDFYNSFPSIWSPYWVDSKIKELEYFLTSLAANTAEKAERTRIAKATDPIGLGITPPPYAGWELDTWIPGYSRYVEELINALIDYTYPAIWPGTAEGKVNNHMYFSGRKDKAALAPMLSKFLNQCVQSIIKHQNKRILVDDNTHSLLFASDVLSLTSNAKMLHIVRDPRDVISSLKTQRWAPNEVSKLVVWYRELMDCWTAQKTALARDQFLEVRFEDFIGQPQKSSSEICAFLGVTFHEAMLDTDLSKHNIGRYKSELTSEEVARIENELSRVFSTYNYL